MRVRESPRNLENATMEDDIVVFPNNDALSMCVNASRCTNHYFDRTAQTSLRYARVFLMSSLLGRSVATLWLTAGLSLC